MFNICENRFKDKVMIVTGAARGIGKSVALRAAREGAKVVVVDLLDEGQAVADQINNDGGEAVFFKVNLCDEKEVEAFVKKSVDTFGRIDVLINNAGVTGIPGKITDATSESFRFIFNTNLYSVFFCSKHVINQFIKQGTGGSIVNTASIAGIVGLKGSPAYAASKHAVNGLTKNMAIDYAKYGIRVNSVNPAPTNTPMVTESFKILRERMEHETAAVQMKKEEVLSTVGNKKGNLQDRFAEPDEQAASILFLASDDASYMTGTILATDGGWTAF